MMGRVRTAAAAYARVARNPTYAVLVAAEQLSAVGDAVSVLAVPIFVFGATGSPVAAGVAVAARSLPWVFIGPAVAVWVDRGNRQAIMVACDVGRALLVAALFFVDQLPLVVLIALGSGTLSAIQRSARAGMIPRVVGADDYPAATSLQRMLLVVGTAVGSAAGGVLIARVGARYGFLADAASFAASAILVLSVRVPPAARRGAGGGGMLEGWRQVFRHAPIAWALWTSTIAFTLSSGGTLLATRAMSEVFHGDASLAGTLVAVVNVGVAFGSLAMGASAWLREHYRPAIGPLSFVAAYAAMTLVPRFEVALVSWTVAGLIMGGHLVYLNVLVVRLLPNSVLGRTTAVINAVGYTSLVVGPYVTGVLLVWLGPRSAPLGLALSGAAALPATAVLTRVVAGWLRGQSGTEGGDARGTSEGGQPQPEAAQAVTTTTTERR